MSKQCSKCSILKPISEFYLRTTRKGVTSQCKMCFREYTKVRWRHRKLKAIELFGGKCSKCEYAKCIGALEFHHLDPSVKDADWGVLKLGSWKDTIAELQKCILVCSNCHRELHEIVENYKTSGKDNPALNREHNPFIEWSGGRVIKEISSTGICPICKEPVYGTKYCSVKCSAEGQRKVVKRPRKDDLQKMVDDSSYLAVGKKFGVSDNAIRKWLK